VHHLAVSNFAMASKNTANNNSTHNIHKVSTHIIKLTALPVVSNVMIVAINYCQQQAITAMANTSEQHPTHTPDHITI